MYYIILILFGFSLLIQGYFYGRYSLQQEWQREESLYNENLRKIYEDVSKMDRYNACIKLGGMSTQCTQFLPEFDETA